jgi:hypothetical protein
MKYIITENKVTKVIQKYFDNLISKPEFDWVDKIKIIPGTTEEDGWSNSNIFPKYTYVVYFKNVPTLISQSKLSEKIGYAHMMFFPLDDKGNGTVYYNTHSVNADGKIDSFPSFKGL